MQQPKECRNVESHEIKFEGLKQILIKQTLTSKNKVQKNSS